MLADSCTEAEAVLIRRLAEIEEAARRKEEGVFRFEEGVCATLKKSPQSHLLKPSSAQSGLASL